LDSIFRLYIQSNGGSHAIYLVELTSTGSTELVLAVVTAITREEMASSA